MRINNMNKYLHSFLFFLMVLSTPVFADNSLNSSLVYYITVGKAEDVFFLLEQGADPNAKDKMGWSALMLASERGDEDTLPIVKSLIKAGADINYKDDKGNTALIVAIKSNNAKLVRYLLAKGANFHVKDSEGSNLKELAAIYSGKEIQWIIDEAFRIEKEQMEDQYSSETFKKLLKEYSFYNCTHQYMDYFLKSGQEQITDPVKYQETMKKQLDLVGYYANQLYSVFDVSREDLKDVAMKSRQNISRVLNEMVSNEIRRSHNVGTTDDILKRCQDVANRWSAVKKSVKEQREPTESIKIELEGIEF